MARLQARKSGVDDARSRALEFGRVHHLYDKHVSAAQQARSIAIMTTRVYVILRVCKDPT